MPTRVYTRPQGSKTPQDGGTPDVPQGQYDIFNRLFGKEQEGGGYLADPIIAETMANRDVLPAPIDYTGGGVSPQIQRRVDLMQSSNPVDALRNPPTGPAMARDNGQAIARNTPSIGLAQTGVAPARNSKPAPFAGSATRGQIRRGEKPMPGSPMLPANLQSQLQGLLNAPSMGVGFPNQVMGTGEFQSPQSAGWGSSSLNTGVDTGRRADDYASRLGSKMPQGGA